MVLFQTVFDSYERLFKLVISLAIIPPLQVKLSAIAQPGIVSRLQNCSFETMYYNVQYNTQYPIWAVGIQQLE